MTTQGKIFGEKKNFLYNAKKYDLIFLPLEELALDERKNLYLEKDILFKKYLKRPFNRKSYVPVSVLDNECGAKSFYFYFDLVNILSRIQTISQFEAEEFKEEKSSLVISAEDVYYLHHHELQTGNSVSKNFEQIYKLSIKKIKLETKARKLAENTENDDYSESIRLRDMAKNIENKIQSIKFL